VLERTLQAELTAHLGFDKHSPEGNGSGNSRNGRIAKTVQTGIGPVGLRVPRDRADTFEPVLIPKRAGRVSGGLDDMIISLCAHGMSVRDILHHLQRVFGTQLSHEQVSRITTDQVLDEVRAWQARPLEAVYAVVFLDAITVKGRDNQVVANKSAYLAIGVDGDGDGEKHMLGIWLAKTPADLATADKAASFWRSVMTDLRNCGVRDILIACCDGLTGFVDAIAAAFPATVSKQAFGSLDDSAERRVTQWPRNRNQGITWKELYRGFFADSPDNRPETDGKLLFLCQKVEVSRYRWRGHSISRPWTDAGTATTALPPGNPWSAGCVETACRVWRGLEETG
jgi:hypothetical protein